MQAIAALVAMVIPVVASLLVLLRMGVGRQAATLDLDTARSLVSRQKRLLDERRPPTAALPDLMVRGAVLISELVLCETGLSD